MIYEVNIQPDVIKTKMPMMTFKCISFLIDSKLPHQTTQESKLVAYNYLQ